MIGRSLNSAIRVMISSVNVDGMPETPIKAVLFDKDGTMSHSEPMLTALVLRETQRVGPGYSEAVARRYGTSPSDPDRHAAEERVRCYQYFGAPEPEGGWLPVYPPLVQRSLEKARPAPPRPNCDEHFTRALPNGECPVCGKQLGD